MKVITLSHGSGGEETQKLIESVFLKHLSNEILAKMEDASVVNFEGQLAFTTDSFVVSPYRFKGGDIGKLAVAGTVNDLAVMGARPKYMSCGFILEEGFPVEELELILGSMASELQRAGMKLITADTKVVPRGSADGIFINASGIGEVICPGISAHNLKEGDVILVSGSVGDHGACILAEREGMNFDTELQSDCAQLWDLVEEVLREGVKPSAMRDPTRGGLAAVLNEWAKQSGVEIEVEEENLPVKSEVQGLCELLGFEPTHLANEGMIVFAVKEGDAERLLEILRSHPKGRSAQIIGRVVSRERSRVVLKTPYGTKRLMEPPSGELLPRIC